MEETGKINHEVEFLMLKISGLLTEQCKLGFEYSLMLSGGVGEGTKVGLPDEYDYLLMVNGLGDQLTPEIADDSKPGYVKLRFSELNSINYQLSTDGYFDSIKFTSHFYELVCSVLHSLDTEKVGFYLFPNEGYFDYGYENDERLKKSANFLITLEYPSRNYGTIDITIDLVPVLKLKPGWWPIHSSNPTEFNEHLCATLTKPAGITKGENLQLRISTSLIELSVIKSVSNTIKSAYIASKILKNIFHCTINGINYQASLYLNTYLIKNALMKYAIETMNDEPNTEKDAIETTIAILSNVSVNSFFFPGMNIERPCEFFEGDEDAGNKYYRNIIINNLIEFLKRS